MNGDVIEAKTLTYSESIEVENKLTTILNNMEDLDVTVQTKMLTGACLELFGKIVEVMQKWDEVLEEEHFE